ncbi:alpha-galactosidase [Streptacidiphilus sp. MAP12-33]|uniref:RICIN domain-containing protein n=1 Tax=Streptacidiphilus sp. MAP12-33 TaxID=3156266 RepID=UPI003516BFA4
MHRRVRTLLTGTAVMASALLGLVPGSAGAAHAEANGVALTPPMGWSSWSFIRKNPTESNIEAQALALKNSGLLSHGYQYVNVDDFWYLDPATTVDSYGRWATDPSHFPDGMGAVGTYVHNLGEKFGMYLTPGIPVAAYNQNTPIAGTSWHARDIVSNTSSYETNYNFGSGSMYYIDYAKNPAAAQAFLDSWADQLASYGVDYLKIDGVGDWDSADIQHWSQALNQAGRPIHLELSNNLDPANAATWRQYANGWRIEGDVECYCGSGSYPLTDWNNVASRFSDVPKWIPFAGPGGWNDLDSLELGNGSNDGLTVDERRTQLTLWAIEGAPLLLGTDLTNLDPTDLSLLTNDRVLAVDQAGVPARPVDQVAQQQVWSAANADGSYTVALFNLGSGTATATAHFADLGFSGAADVQDLWAGTDLGSSTGSFSASLAGHASMLLKITPTTGDALSTLHYDVVNAATGQYLDTSGSALVTAAANGGTDQQWQLPPTGDQSYRIANVGSGQAATLGGNTLWTFTPNGSGAYTVTSRLDGQVLGVSGSSVVEQSANGTAAQTWKLAPVLVPGQRYRIVNGATGGRIDVNNDSTADNAAILQWQDNGRTDQLWSFVAQSGGAVTIVNANSGKLLNIPGPTTTQGTQLIQYHDDGNSNSRWTVLDAGPNLVSFRSSYDGQLIDLNNSGRSNGTSVLQWPSDGGTNQTWSLLAPE